MINPNSFAALAALAGSVIGGLTSVATTWLSQHSEFRRNRLIRDREARETISAKFIDEASALYAEAFTHDMPAPAELAKLYALISRMRLLTSRIVVEKADEVMRRIVDAYLAPNKTFSDVPELFRSGALNPLKEFSEVCRDELWRLGKR
jgi:hypothetical protein